MSEQKAPLLTTCPHQWLWRRNGDAAECITCGEWREHQHSPLITMGSRAWKAANYWARNGGDDAKALRASLCRALSELEAQRLALAAAREENAALVRKIVDDTPLVHAGFKLPASQASEARLQEALEEFRNGDCFCDDDTQDWRLTRGQEVHQARCILVREALQPSRAAEER